LGYVQIDTVSVIQRAHHHVLWSRVADYHPKMLHELQSPDVAVFEYWDHASSYLPTNDYRFSLPRMRQYRSESHWFDDCPELRKSMRQLLGMIHQNGPLMISDVESKASVQAWSAATLGKIERRALHELWMRGEIMIRSRKGFQKVFDLPERVLPAETNRVMPSKREAARFRLHRALKALGIARLNELDYLQGRQGRSDLWAELTSLVEGGEIMELRIAEFPKVAVYALRKTLEDAAPIKTEAVRILSPFDNLVIQRKRLKWLFDFDYVVEMYVPPAKRRYGYFVLPLLWGDRLVGRLDAKACRAERLLRVHSLVFEPKFLALTAIKSPLVAALDEFARFQECDRWEILRVEPPLRIS
jgi:uncharacterized protein YcaQ